MAFRALAPILLLLLVGVRAGAAQAVRLCPPPGAAVDTAARPPDLVIRASARAEQVRFETRPEVRVRLTGCAVLDTVRVLERRNLPQPVQPGVTYRDVFVAVEILGYLDAQCLLAALCPLARPDSVPRPPPPPPR